VAATRLKVSVIDLGYNSLKLVSYEVKRDKTFAAYGQESILARVGEGLDETGMLGDQPIKRTLNALKLLRDIVELQHVDHVLPIATSAVREAGNKALFLKQAVVDSGFAFKVLSEREEAVYSYSGARAALAVDSGLFFDLGGGSLEMVLFEETRIRKILSVPLGALRLTDLYAGKDGGFSRKNYVRMRKRIVDLLPGPKDFPADQKLDLVGVGGTVRAIARFDQIREKYPVNKLHNYTMKRNSVQLVHQTLNNMEVKDIKRITSIGQDRARSIVAGSLVIQLLMEKIDFRRLIVSTHGLRDGVLAAFLQDPVSYRKGSIDSLIQRPKNVSSNTQSPGRQFIESLYSGGLMNKRERAILLQAVEEIPDLPLTNPETLFYVALESDSVLSHPDQIILSLSLAHARGMKRTDWIQATYQGLLDDDTEETVERIAAIIKLSEILEETGSRIRVNFEGRHKIRVKVEHGHRHFPEELLRASLKDFEEVFDLKIT
jgi:exopolyphosphatase/guanosine-5'-triphosphate,3'-diphosphate pyrophosphatase